MAASDHFPGAGGRCSFSWGIDAIKRARAAGVSVCTTMGSFPSTMDRRRATYSAADISFPPALIGYGPRGFQVRVSLKGPQRRDLFVGRKDYGLDVMSHHRIEADFRVVILEGLTSGLPTSWRRYTTADHLSKSRSLAKLAVRHPSCPVPGFTNYSAPRL